MDNCRKTRANTCQNRKVVFIRYSKYVNHKCFVFVFGSQTLSRIDEFRRDVEENNIDTHTARISDSSGISTIITEYLAIYFERNKRTLVISCFLYSVLVT